MQKIYKVTLTTEECLELTQLVSNGKSNAKTIKHANILLAVDETANGRVSDQEVAQHFHCHAHTVANICERFVEEGFDAVLERQKRLTPPTPILFDGCAEAHLERLACSTPPDGRANGRSNCSPINASNSPLFHTRLTKLFAPF